jgi:hypothetical protein
MPVDTVNEAAAAVIEACRDNPAGAPLACTGSATPGAATNLVTTNAYGCKSQVVRRRRILPGGCGRPRGERRSTGDQLRGAAGPGPARPSSRSPVVAAASLARAVAWRARTCST